MAVMAMLTWRGIDGIVRAQQSTHRYTDDVLALQAGLAQWRADLDAMMVWPAAQVSAIPPPGGLPSVPMAQRSLVWDGSVLRITRAAAGLPADGLRVVAWTRRSDGQWLRWQSAPVLSHQAWQSAWDEAARWGQVAAVQTPDTARGAQAVVVTQVLEWQLHYYRNNAWTNPLSSGAESATVAQALPDGVRLFITLAPGQSLAGPMVIDWVRPTLGGGG